MAFIHGIPLKKQFGQHFLRQDSIVHTMIAHVALAGANVLEVGPGEGFLTRHILQQPVERLWSFEIDTDWVHHLQATITDPRFTVFEENILDVDFSRFREHAPWVLLANLPYQITFPILRMLHAHRDIITHGVFMIQEEVAQKLVKTSGRGYGFPSLFYNHYFELEMLTKVPPTAFYPPPKVFSRLVYFKAKPAVVPIPDEENFWKFIKICFHQPRRTLRNNLAQSQYDLEKVPQEQLALRAQQFLMDDLLKLWDLVRG
ncbi:ribosomal RNA small subunit methyltransferase A [Candidatus Dependentiae bacterium HGW-Dependentiae-1]|nr:MAG: ribosomal RNA small subunit methyltransferase A [Candidatus Dependentiae bacterium HGW-Dependentiae-1]